MKHYKSLNDFHKENGAEPPENPLLSLVRLDKICPIKDKEFTTDFYMIALKKVESGLFLYGRTKYDNENGSMYFIQPRQVVEMKNLEFEEDGFIIFMHEDYLNGHLLHHEITKYNYFDYETNEALHLSPKEEQVIWELFFKIEAEYNTNQDEYSREIILTHLDSILKYSQRFYKRQFINRSEISGKMVTRFNDILSAYIETGDLSDKGLPTVHHMADQLNISAKYLSDLLKQETGKTGIELIHIFLISQAKNSLKGATESIAEIAYNLGFENVSYFSRLFKQQVGITPKQFKQND